MGGSGTRNRIADGRVSQEGPKGLKHEERVMTNSNEQRNRRDQAATPPDGAGAAAREATGQIPAAPVHDEVIRSEKDRPSENAAALDDDTRRRTGPPAGIKDKGGS
jgi:hypothetical protein